MKNWKNFIIVYIYIIVVGIVYVLTTYNINILIYSTLLLVVYFILVVGYNYLYNNYINKKLKGIEVFGYYPEYKKVFYVLNSFLLAWFILLAIAIYPIFNYDEGIFYEINLGGSNIEDIDFKNLVDEILIVTNSTDGNIYRNYSTEISFDKDGEITWISLDFYIVTGTDIKYYRSYYMDDKFTIHEKTGHTRDFEMMDSLIILNNWIIGLEDISIDEIINYYGDNADISYYYIRMPHSIDLYSWIIYVEDGDTIIEYDSLGEEFTTYDSTSAFDKDAYYVYQASIVYLLSDESKKYSDEEISFIYPIE